MCKILANFILNDMRGILNKSKLNLEGCGISPDIIGILSKFVYDGMLDKRAMRRLVIKWSENKSQ